MPQTKALITPAVLRWAREQAGYDLHAAAKKMDVPVATLDDWENGSALPSLAQARTAAEVYRRALAVFYLQKPPSDFETPRDFRRLPGETPRLFSPEFLFLARRLIFSQGWLAEYRRDAGYKESLHAGSARPEDAAKLARSIRSTLGIGIDWHRHCRTRDDALRFWISRVEDVGICVRRDPGVELAEARGLALSDPWAPMLWINAKDSAAGKLFTLAHELAHIWLGESGVSNLSNTGKAPVGTAELEVFCNRTAASILVAPEIFDRELEQMRRSGQSAETISRLSQHLKVSDEVIARMLLDRRAIKTSDYERLRHEFNDRWLHRSPKRLGHPSYLTLKIACNGYRFTREVLTAYQGDYATATEASDLLDLKINLFPKIISQIQAHATTGGIR